MAWGRSEPQPQASAFSQIFPLVVVIVILSIAGFVGYQVYLMSLQIRDQTSERMGKKNVVFTKDGLKVGVKEIQDEKYVDKTQSWVVKAWNLANVKVEEKAPAKLKKKK